MLFNQYPTFHGGVFSFDLMGSAMLNFYCLEINL